MNLLQQAKSNSFFSNSFFIFLIRFFPTLANVLVLIYYSHKLATVSYGTYQNFWIQLNIFYPLACFGIHVFIITYSPAYILSLARSIRRGQYAIYGAWLLLLCGIFAYLQYNPLNISFIVPFLFLLVYAVTLILESLLIVFRSFKSVVLLNLLFSTAFFLIHWYVLKDGFSLQKLFTSLFIISVLRLIAYVCIAGLQAKKQQTSVPEEIPVAKARSLWLHLSLFDILQMSFSWIDKFIISLVLSASLSAIYYNGSINIPFLPLLLSAAGSAVLIELSAVKKENETQHTVLLMRQSAKVLSSIIFPFFFFLLFYRYQLIVAVFSEKYIPAIPVFFVSTLVLPLKAYNFTTVLQNQHKGAIINTGAFLDISLACLLMYPLYKWLGLPGVVLSFVITTYLQAAFYLFHSAHTLGLNLFSLLPIGNWLAKLIVFAIALIAIRYVTSLYFTGIISLILGSIATALIVLISLFFEMKKMKQVNVNS